MFEVRIHGRGGQGVVTAAELLSNAAFEKGRYAQAFPSFGSERTGAPVVAYCRVSEDPIRTREPILNPDAVIVQDATLLHQVDVFGGLKPDGYVLINSRKTIEELELTDLLEGRPAGRVMTFPASDIAREYIGRPLPNAVLLGGLAALTRRFGIKDVVSGLNRKFSGKIAEGNIAAANRAYEMVTERLKEHVNV
ncbi:MAG TPA: 2-oxoacid:acceptor oxidoreductase family protein [Actinomycetaceae bacterium]|nr:2-oxoacid:acceptor oxidoreductase family protein [Actinomycetaceae bacterium]